MRRRRIIDDDEEEEEEEPPRRNHKCEEVADTVEPRRLRTHREVPVKLSHLPVIVFKGKERDLPSHSNYTRFEVDIEVEGVGDTVADDLYLRSVKDVSLTRVCLEGKLLVLAPFEALITHAVNGVLAEDVLTRNESRVICSRRVDHLRVVATVRLDVFIRKSMVENNPVTRLSETGVGTPLAAQALSAKRVLLHFRARDSEDTHVGLFNVATGEAVWRHRLRDHNRDAFASFAPMDDTSVARCWVDGHVDVLDVAVKKGEVRTVVNASPASETWVTVLPDDWIMTYDGETPFPSNGRSLVFRKGAVVFRTVIPETRCRPQVFVTPSGDMWVVTAHHHTSSSREWIKFNPFHGATSKDMVPIKALPSLMQGAHQLVASRHSQFVLGTDTKEHAGTLTVFSGLAGILLRKVTVPAFLMVMPPIDTTCVLLTPLGVFVTLDVTKDVRL